MRPDTFDLFVRLVVSAEEKPLLTLTHFWLPPRWKLADDIPLPLENSLGSQVNGPRQNDCLTMRGRCRARLFDEVLICCSDSGGTGTFELFEEISLTGCSSMTNFMDILPSCTRCTSL